MRKIEASRALLPSTAASPGSLGKAWEGRGRSVLLIELLRIKCYVGGNLFCVDLNVFACGVLPAAGLGALVRLPGGPVEMLAQLGSGLLSGWELDLLSCTRLEGWWESRCCSKAQAELFQAVGLLVEGKHGLPSGAFSSPPFWCC